MEQLLKQIRVYCFFILTLPISLFAQRDTVQLIDISKIKSAFDAIYKIDSNVLTYDSITFIARWPNNQLRCVHLRRNVSDSIISIVYDYVGTILIVGEIGVNESKQLIRSGRNYFFRFKNTQQVSHFYTFKNNVYHGICMSYFETGELESITYWNDFEECGIWKYYNKSGEIIRTENHD